MKDLRRLETMKISSILKKRPEKKVGSEEINEVFQVDGIPLWYFVKPLMFESMFLVRPFRNLMKFDKSAAKFKIRMIFVRKGLTINEKIKLMLSRFKTAETGKKDILFLAYTNQIFRGEKGESEFLGFNDVIRELKKQGINPLILIADPLSKNSFLKLKGHDNLLYGYIDSEIIKKSEKLARDLHRKWEELDEKIKMRIFSSHEGRYWLNTFLFSSEILSILIRNYLTFKKIIKKHDISVVHLAGLKGIYELALLGAVYKLDKMVLYTPHGYYRELGVGREFTKNVIFAVSGDEEKKRLLRLGIKKEHVFVTGSPFFDKVAEYRLKTKSKKGKTVALITNPLFKGHNVRKSEYFEYVHNFLDQIGRTKSVEKIIVKLHPGEDGFEYESIIKSLKLKNAEVVQKLEKEVLYSILRDSDLIVSYGSTTDIEGLMLDKNVIVIEGFKGDVARKDLYKRAVIQVEKDGNLKATVNKILDDKETQKRLKRKREKYLQKSFYKIDGKAHKRVADLIASLIKKSP